MRTEAEKALAKRGCRQITKAAKCCGCGKEFEWWRTGRGKLIPLDAIDLKPHWRTCRNAFRNKMPPTRPAGYFRWPSGYG